MALIQPRHHRPLAAIPFVGRHEERAWLRGLLAETAAGEPRFALIRGEPGAGKTRLAREFLAEAEFEGWQALTARCLEGASSPLAPFVAELVPRLRDAGILNQAPNAEPATDGPSFARLIAALATRRQLVLLADDIQWLEGGGLSFFRDIVLALSDLAGHQRFPLLLIATARAPHDDARNNEVIARLLRESISRALDLDGLGDVETNEFVRGALGANCEPGLLQFLTETTRGNPLFLGEALRDLSVQGLVFSSGDAIRTTIPPQRLAVPASAPDALRGRLARLPAAMLRTIELAALLGDDFDRETLELFEPGVSATLDGLVDEGLLLGDGDLFRFPHTLIRKATLEHLPPGRRRAIHASIATALREAHGDSPGYALEIAEHIAASNPATTMDTASLFEQAGDVAMERFAWNHGVRYYSRAVECAAYLEALEPGPRGRLLAKLARSYDNCGDIRSARASYRAAIDCLRQTQDFEGWGLAIIGWERTFPPLGETIPDLTDSNEFRAACGDAVPAVRARLSLQWAEELWMRRDPGDLAAAMDGLADAVATRDTEVIALAHTRHGLALMRHLRAAESLSAYRAAIAATESISNPRIRGWGLARAGIPLLMLGSLRESRETIEAALDHATGGDDWPHSALSLSMLTGIAALQGDRATQSSAAARAAMMFRRAQSAQAGYLLHAFVIRDRLARGEVEEAASTIDELEPLSGRAVAGAFRALTRVIEAVIDEQAAPHFELPRPEWLREPDFTSLAATAVWAEVAALTRDPEIAAPAYDGLLTAQRAGVRVVPAPCLVVERLLAGCSRAMGQHWRAQEHARSALAEAQAIGARAELGPCHLEVALAEQDPTETRHAALKSARSLFRALNMDAWLAVARAAGPTSTGAPLQSDQHDLSASELAVLEGVATGLSVEQLGQGLLLSPRSVEGIQQRLAIRLGVHSRTDAANLLNIRSEPAATAVPALAAGPAPAIALSHREQEVLGLIARGCTNQQIADELVLSLHTVARHVSNIFDKTGARNRTEASRFINGIA